MASVEQTVEPDEASQVLLGDVVWHDYVVMDDAIHTTDVDDDNWEAALVVKAQDRHSLRRGTRVVVRRKICQHAS